VLAAGFGIGRATAYRYRDEVVTVLAEQAPDLHEALHEVADEGWSHVVLDGKVFSDRPLRRDHHQHQREDRPFLVLGQASGVRRERAGHHAPGRCAGLDLRSGRRSRSRPHRRPRWSGPGRAVLGGIATEPARAADGGYESAGQGVHVPFKRPSGGNVVAVDHLVATRCNAACAHWANAASHCSPVVGGGNASPPARPGSETSLLPE